MEKEEWRDIKGFEGLYQISNKSRIRILDKYVNSGLLNNPKVFRKGKIKRLQTSDLGYKHTTLYKNGKMYNINVHRVLMETFCPNKSNFKHMPYEDPEEIDLDKLVINHKDMDPSNNALENLEWCTQSYNINYGDRKEKVLRGILKTAYNFKPIVKMDLSGNVICEYRSVKQAAKENNMYRSQITRCANGEYSQSGGYKWKFK